MSWSKYRYGSGKDSGYWTLTDGECRFDIHPSYDGSNTGRYPNNVIISPKMADEYAEKILDALNAVDIEVQR